MKSNQESNSFKTKISRVMKQRWAMPALYLTVSAIALTAYMGMTSLNNEQASEAPPEAEVNMDDAAYEDNNELEDAVPVTSHEEPETFALPAQNVDVVGTFHEFDADEETLEKAFVHYNNYYYQNKGIDLASSEGETFDVAASMSGRVVKANEDPLFGQVVHIEHKDGVVSIYQSLSDVTVAEGDEVEQGDVIGQAGRNRYNEEAGVHAHFEIRKDGIPLNPMDAIDQPITSLPSAPEGEASEAESEPTP
ncbi:M23 family metallopeptidase [Paenalkalicoccus suaedae]|uniref:M23 family metallopeptidase n=1 Tax=Paenalkalicoccus suaedae TaxID=2592382 RepID=A0A859FIU7_9BACI|nr:M23 family metallopeptidase [Paenalkalicoccus suaedae]QKS72744.1 M23 family metallopeptidase [Paenalkalicoccus suaedae]